MTTTAITPINEVRQSLERMKPEFARTLPPQIDPDKFVRVSITAVQNMPMLLECDRKTLYSACMKCATDGLLPDGREAAIVKFGSSAQYMPMVAGIMKKVRQSGELLSLAAHVVYSNDQFEYVLGDEERIIHHPFMGEDRGRPITAYAIAKTKDGGIYRDVMSVAEIERVRSVSRGKDRGPWVDWWDEMAKKTVIRRLSKRLPMSTDTDEFFRRRDEEETIIEAPAIEVIPEKTEPKRVSRMQAAIDATVTVDEDGVIDDGFGEVA